MDAVAALPPGGGLTGAACAALGLSRAGFHRRSVVAKRPAAPSRPRPRPARALAAPERKAAAPSGFGLTEGAFNITARFPDIFGSLLAAPS